MAYKVSASKKSNAAMLITGIVVLGLVITGAIGLVVYNFVFSGKPNNTKTFCPADGPLGHVVLLVDKSDPMTFTQRKDFEVAYRQIVSTQVQKGYLLSVYALSDNFTQTAEPLLELCNPGDGSGASEVSENPAMLRKAFNESYIKPMMELADDLVTDTPGKASPILEMVQLVSITGFAKHAVPGEKRLIIVSDMIQHTKDLSMYKSVPKYETFLETPYGRKSQAKLNGAKVEFRMLLHTPKIQNESLFNFWRQHVKQSGGKFASSEPING